MACSASGTRRSPGRLHRQPHVATSLADRVVHVPRRRDGSTSRSASATTAASAACDVANVSCRLPLPGADGPLRAGRGSDGDRTGRYYCGTPDVALLGPFPTWTVNTDPNLDSATLRPSRPTARCTTRPDPDVAEITKTHLGSSVTAPALTIDKIGLDERRPGAAERHLHVHRHQHEHDGRCRCRQVKRAPTTCARRHATRAATTATSMLQQRRDVDLHLRRRCTRTRACTRTPPRCARTSVVDNAETCARRPTRGPSTLTPPPARRPPARRRRPASSRRARRRRRARSRPRAA